MPEKLRTYVSVLEHKVLQFCTCAESGDRAITIADTSVWTGIVRTVIKETGIVISRVYVVL